MSDVRSFVGLPHCEQVADIIARVASQHPLVHFLSSSVALPFVADALLASGARPMMTATATDAAAMNLLADASVVNLATLNEDATAAIGECLPSLGARGGKNHPWVLDPAAVGAPPRRSALARQVLQAGPTVVRANASEVLNLMGYDGGGRGPDSTAAVEAARAAASALAGDFGTVVAVSGATDLIVDGEQQLLVARGVAQLAKVNGSGCLLGGLIAACAAVASDPFLAAVAGTVWLDLAGEIAYRRQSRIGNFKVELINALEEISRWG